MPDLALVAPNATLLEGYADALRRGWDLASPPADVQLERISEDPVAFLERLDDPGATGGPITLPNGETVPRLPSFHRWLSDGEFAGTFNVRWQPGTPDLPPYVLGHVAYSVVNWRRRRGYATTGLGLLLEELRADETFDLPYLEICTDEDNLASQRVILSCGGALVEEFERDQRLGGATMRRFRVDLH